MHVLHKFNIFFPILQLSYEIVYQNRNHQLLDKMTMLESGKIIMVAQKLNSQILVAHSVH